MKDNIIEAPTLLEALDMVKMATLDDDLWNRLIETAKFAEIIANNDIPALSDAGKNTIRPIYGFAGLIAGLEAIRSERSPKN